MRRPGLGASSLSGGNLQKFIVGREILLGPRVLIVAQPTWGVDVAAAAFIRQKLIDLSRGGAAVLVISEELDELFEMCDRIAVICRGRLSPAQPLAATERRGDRPADGRRRLIGRRTLMRLVLERRAEPSRLMQVGGAAARPGADPGWSARSCSWRSASTR